MDSLINDDLMEKGRCPVIEAGKRVVLDAAVNPLHHEAEEEAISRNQSPESLSRKISSWTVWLTKLLSISLFSSKTPDNTDNDTTEPEDEPRKYSVRTFNQCPKGYPRLAAFLSSDENFMIYRKFSFLQARLLLFKQDELRALESDLDYMDGVDENDAPDLLQSRERDDARSGRRKKLMGEIELKFQEYTNLIMTARDFASFNKPPSQDYLSVKGYFDNEAHVCNVENYIYCKEDIISLKPGREDAWLDGFLARALRKFSCRLTRFFLGSRELLEKADPRTTGISLYSRSRTDVVVALINIFTILALLIVPVYILLRLTHGPQNNPSTGLIIVVLLICTLVFTAVLALFTRAKRHEILASAAAYCAVLVVFVGNIGQISSSAND